MATKLFVFDSIEFEWSTPNEKLQYLESKTIVQDNRKISVRRTIDRLR